MTFNPSLWLLARSQDGYRLWGRFDHASTTSEIKPVLFLLGGFALVAILAIVWNVFKRRSQRLYTSNSTSRLFRELCRAHQLSRADRRLLKNLAAAKAESPAMLFIKPESFDGSRLPDALKSESTAIRKLHARLFNASQI